MKSKYLWVLYLIFDWMSAILAWLSFNYFRKTFIEGYAFEINDKLIYSSIAIPIFWILLYVIFGNYKNIYRKYRIKELTQTISQSFLGVILLFFVFILDDKINTYQDYYNLIIALFILQVLLTLIPRIIITTNTVNKIHNGKIGFNTLIIGSKQKAFETYEEITQLKKSSGHFFKGYVTVSYTHLTLPTIE